MVQSPEDLKNTAYHEAGHAVLTLLLPETDTLHKVTIIPRGRALGVTMNLPEEDKNTYTRVELESRIAILFGGRAAELIIFNKYTTGASNDIKKATELARSMVCKWGMSELVGPMAVGEQSQEVFIGREWVANKDHSEETARLVDAEVKRIIDEGMAMADKLLRENIDSLHRVAEALLDRETITGDEVKRLMKGEILPPLDLKANPRKLVTTKDLEKQQQEEAKTRKSGSSVSKARPQADADYAPGYDLYGEPDPAEDKAEEEHKQEMEADRTRVSVAKEDGKPPPRSPLGAALSAPRPDSSKSEPFESESEGKNEGDKSDRKDS